MSKMDKDVQLFIVAMLILSAFGVVLDKVVQ